MIIKESLKEHLRTIYKALDDKKAEDIQIIDISEVSPMADYFVIANGTNVNQVHALCDNVSEELAKTKVLTKQTEGYTAGNWILMDYGDIIVVLRADVAPKTVENFVSLCNGTFLRGKSAHTLVNGMLYFGATAADGGASGIKGEFSENGLDNKVKMEKGTICIARGKGYDSGYRQFFILTEDAPELQGKYAAFGKITEGQDIAIDISRVQRSMFNDKPKKDQKIASITVDPKGETYPEPKKLPDPYGRF